MTEGSPKSDFSNKDILSFAVAILTIPARVGWHGIVWDRMEPYDIVWDAVEQLFQEYHGMP